MALGWGTALVVLGLLWMLAAGMRAGRYRPGWFDPDDGPPCAFTPQGCPADLEAALRGLWWWVGAGGVVVLLGVVLVAVALSPEEPPSFRVLPGALHAAVTGLATAVATGVALLPALFLVLLGEHLLPGLVLAAWLGQGLLVAALHAWGAAAAPRRSWLVGLGVSAAGTAAVAVLLFAAPSLWGSWGPVMLADGAVVAGAVLVVRIAGGPWTGRRPAAPVRAGGAAAVLAVLAGVLVGLVASQRPDLVLARPPSRPVPVAPEVPSLPPPTAAPVPSAPVPSTTPPAPVTADVPCAPADLRLEVGGFDAAMGARAASVQATNVGAAPCWLEGVPVVTLWQGGRPLRLAVEPGSAPTGGPAVAQRVGVAPGGSALALLTWRTYAGWADAGTPQAVTVAVDPSWDPVDVPIVPGSGPAPFDIADGGTWAVAPWAPPSERAEGD
ncbi:DUF4232 domain-containing protein [Blastococcus sp. TF02A-35]|nr:DUF4232 domain-containing protein [Blastococcus sp. TF02A_35]